MQQPPIHLSRRRPCWTRSPAPPRVQQPSRRPVRHLSQIDGDLRRGGACCGGPRPRLACGGVPRRDRACGGRGLQRGNRLSGTAEGASKSSCFFSSDMIAGAKKLWPQLYSASEYCENYCDKRSIGLALASPSWHCKSARPIRWPPRAREAAARAEPARSARARMLAR